MDYSGKASPTSVPLDGWKPLPGAKAPLPTAAMAQRLWASQGVVYVQEGDSL